MNARVTPATQVPDGEARQPIPLNGVQTHPLSTHAVAELRDLQRRPAPRSTLNPGVSNRLLRESLVESVTLPSPFKTHKGKGIEHLQITAAGEAALRNLR